MGKMAGKPHRFSTLLKFRDFQFHTSEKRLAFRQWLNATLGSLMKVVDLEIWHQLKENVEHAIRRGKTIPIDFWPLWALIEAMILPLQGNSSPPDIWQ